MGQLSLNYGKTGISTAIKSIPFYFIIINSTCIFIFS